jgi:hypothetical protein
VRSDIMLPVIRRMAVILMLLGTGGTLAACGGSIHAATPTVVRTAGTTGVQAAAATGAPARTGKSLTRAQARAFAHAVNLRTADVPGFKVSSENGNEREAAGEKRLERKMLRCVGAAGPNRQLTEVSSKEFEREDGKGAQNVQSGVVVEQTSALAVKELAAVRSERGRRCFSHYLDLLFKGQKYRGVSVGPVSISQGSPPAPGTTGSFGWRITATITVHRVRVPFYADILGFVYGPAEVTLLSFGLPEPFPAATQQRLFSLLLTRAKMHGA